MFTNLNLIDSHSLYSVQPRLRGNHDHGVLVQRVLPEIRLRYQLPDAQATITSITRDPRREGQNPFVDHVRASGAVPDELPFWHAIVQPPSVSDAAQSASKVTSLGATLSYLLGLIAGRAEALNSRPSAVVVSGATEIAHPAQDFVENRGGQLVVAFYRAYLDWPRWEPLFKDQASLQFADLDEWRSHLISSRGIGPNGLRGI